MKRGCLTIILIILGFCWIQLTCRFFAPYRITSYNIQKQIEGKIVCVHFENDSTGFILSSISSSDFEWPDVRYLQDQHYSLYVYKTKDRGKNWNRILEKDSVYIDYTMWVRNSFVADHTIIMIRAGKTDSYWQDSVIRYDCISNSLSWDPALLASSTTRSAGEWAIPTDTVLKNFPPQYSVACIAISEEVWAAEIIEDVLEEHIYYSYDYGQKWIKVRRYFPEGLNGLMCVYGQNIYICSGRKFYIINTRKSK